MAMLLHSRYAQILKLMRFKILFILIAVIGQNTFAQIELRKKIIQNFYTTCKANKYSAFMKLMKGQELFEFKQYSRSLNNFHKALEIDSNLCDAWYLIGFCHQEQGEYQKSIVACDKSIKLNPKNPSAWTIKGNTLLYKQDTANALIAFEKARQYAPEKIDGYFGIALIMYWRKKYDKALQTIKDFESKGDRSNLKRDIRKMNKLKSQMILNE